MTIVNPASTSGAAFEMGTQNVTITVLFVPSVLTFGNQTLANGTVGTAYEASITPPTGGSGTYTYSAVLPAGLIMSPTGEISGAPNGTVTSQTFVVTVTDTISGATQSATYTLTITDFGEVPSTNGFPDITSAMLAMLILLAISAVLWGYVLWNKCRKNVG